MCILVENTDKKMAGAILKTHAARRSAKTRRVAQAKTARRAGGRAETRRR
jgi:hypothetical protein